MTELKQVKEALEDIVKLASKGIDNPVLLTIENEASDALVELERYQESRLRILENAVPGGVSDDAPIGLTDGDMARLVMGVVEELRRTTHLSMPEVRHALIQVSGGSPPTFYDAVCKTLARL
jgi:hypothetical protein